LENGEFQLTTDANTLSLFLITVLYGLQVLGRAGFEISARKDVLVIALQALP
jgi:hypothetical protein